MKKKLTSLVLCLAVIVSLLSTVAMADFDHSEFASTYQPPTTMRGLTAFQLVSDMGAGWNLGNTLESENKETYWGNPETTKAMIDTIAATGFTTLRVPTRWDDHYTDGNYTIDPTWMSRVETVVNYGLANDMYVILNVHHNDLQTKVNEADAPQVKAELKAIWTQIAKHFAKYGDKLIFEVNNEPRYNEDWNGDETKYRIVNECNEVARAAIRATGGNNAKRLIMLPTYCASADSAKVLAWKGPSNDSMIAASIHAYHPFDFAFDRSGHGDWRSSDVDELSATFDRLYTTFISKGIPVVMGEFGSIDKNTNLSDRVKHVKAYGEMANRYPEQSIPCVWWDNNCYKTSGENFGIFNREELDFSYSDGSDMSVIAKTLISTYQQEPSYETKVAGEKVWSDTKATATAWNQALTLGTAPVTSLKSGESVKVAFTGGDPQLILQSWSGGSVWCAINPSNVSGGVATWTYEDIVKAYEKFRPAFNGLDQVYIGASNTSVTVTKVYSVAGAPHTHQYTVDGGITVPATATTMGRKTMKCSVSGCTATRVIRIPATGSTWRFADVSESIWYAAPIKRISDRRIMNGTTDTTFSPDMTVTRGQLVTMLWNMEGQPKGAKDSGFKDVESGRFYYSAVAWGKETGVVHGYSDNTYRPGNPVTRQEFITILHNYAKYRQLDVTPVNPGGYKKCKDYKDASSYALKAVAWGYDRGLIAANNKLEPKREIPRYQAAVILDRFLTSYNL